MMERTTTFLAARTSALDFGLEAASVSQVVLCADWDGPAPIDIEQLLRGEIPVGTCRHVLVIRGAHGSCTLGTVRELVLRECPGSEIHDLPALIWEPGSQPILRGISLLPNEPPLLVLDCDVLEARLLAQPLQGEPH
jgi:hypothetical protein